jgi:hypothetical protein
MKAVGWAKRSVPTEMRFVVTMWARREVRAFAHPTNYEL